MPDTSSPPPPAPDADDSTVVRPAATPSQEPAAPIAPTAPLFAERYALVRLIGRGGMGAVYEARDTLVGDTVALKQLELGQEAANADALERFSREVRLARRITHPQVARMHDLGTHEGKAFLTMEYVEGEDLRELLARRRGGTMGTPEAVRIALAVCEGLAAAHAAGVVHRDLKPANILIERGGRVVLTDFGIARALAEERASRTQGAIGTPLYMAPEQVAGEPVDARADLYAVGLLLYELLTGQLPFSAETPWGAAIARLNQSPPDLRQNAAVPLPLARLVHHCLERHPSRRPQDALEVAGALRDWLARSGGTPQPHVTTTPRPEAFTSSTPRPGTTSLTVPRGLALLPLRYLGPADSSWLGDALSEALIDQLSRTRGLHVLGSGVVERFRDTRDPRAVGGELGVDFVVDGTMQSAGPSVRASVRLLDARSGGQLWSGRFDCPADALEIQDRLSPRISEELRVEVLLAHWRARAVPEALVLYRQAHQQINREMRSSSEGPGELLRRCLELSADFAPALALHALASVRAWFSSRGDSRAAAVQLARDSVEHALREASDLPETHLARGMLSAQDNDWRSAMSQIRMALDIAPYHPMSLQYLGAMQCEAGHPEEGLERLRLAYALVPGMGGALVDYARTSALLGRMEDYRWAMTRLAPLQPHRPVMDLLRVRIAAWTGDVEEARRVRVEALVTPDTVSQLTGLYVAVVLGEAEVDGLARQFEELLAQRDNPRFRSMTCQFATELLCLLGAAERALPFFRRAADTALIDLDWVEQCPAIKPLRLLPGFAEGRTRVRNRVEAIWNT